MKQPVCAKALSNIESYPQYPSSYLRLFARGTTRLHADVTLSFHQHAIDETNKENFTRNFVLHLQHVITTQKSLTYSIYRCICLHLSTCIGSSRTLRKLYRCMHALRIIHLSIIYKLLISS